MRPERHRRARERDREVRRHEEVAVAAERVLRRREGRRELRGDRAEAAAVARIGLEKLEIAARRAGIGIIEQADIERAAGERPPDAGIEVELQIGAAQLAETVQRRGPDAEHRRRSCGAPSRCPERRHGHRRAKCRGTGSRRRESAAPSNEKAAERPRFLRESGRRQQQAGHAEQPRTAHQISTWLPSSTTRLVGSLKNSIARFGALHHPAEQMLAPQRHAGPLRGDQLLPAEIEAGPHHVEARRRSRRARRARAARPAPP